MPLEVLLELLRVHALGGLAALARLVAEHLRPLAVEVDQLLRRRLALGRIGVQQLGRALAAQHGRELPAQVEGVLHREVHALARLGAVGVAGVAGDEHARQLRTARIRRHVVVLVADALADLVHRPPGHLLHLQRVGLQDALRRGDEVVERDAAVGDALLLAQLVHLDVQAHQVAALARDHQQVAVHRLHRRLVADVREVGHGQHVHHAPGLVGRIAHQLATDGLAHRAARPVAADHVAGPHGLDLARMRGVGALQPHRHRVVTGLRVHRHVEHAARVVRFEPRRCVAHALEVEVVHARLVQHDVGELREPVLGVLHAAVAHDPAGLALVGLPEGHLVDPAGFLQHALAEVEGLEHFHGATGDAVGLAELQRPVLLLHDRGADVREGGELRGQRQARGAAADDEHVHLSGHRIGVRKRRRRGLFDVGIARLEAIQVELHGVSLSRSGWEAGPGIS